MLKHTHTPVYIAIYNICIYYIYIYIYTSYIYIYILTITSSLHSGQLLVLTNLTSLVVLLTNLDQSRSTLSVTSTACNPMICRSSNVRNLPSNLRDDLFAFAGLGKQHDFKASRWRATRCFCTHEVQLHSQRSNKPICSSVGAEEILNLHIGINKNRYAQSSGRASSSSQSSPLRSPGAQIFVFSIFF